MRTDLQPNEGTPVKVGGIEFHLLFTFAAIDQLQTFYNEPLSDVVRRLTDNMTMYSATGHILDALISSDIYNNSGGEANAPEYEQIMHVLDTVSGGRAISAIFKAYGLDMPEPEEDEEDEDEKRAESEKMNIARLLVIGKTELGMTEAEFWQTTPRKFFKLFEEFASWRSGDKPEAGSIDALP